MEKKLAAETPKAGTEKQSNQWELIKWLVKKLLIVIVVLIALLAGTNMVWLYVLQCYNYTITVACEQ